MVFTPIQIWAIAGIILIIADVFSLTFFLFFLGVGALVTSVFIWIGLAPGFGAQLICFALSSLVVMLLFRSALRKMFGKKGGQVDYMEYVGQRAVVTVAIPARGEGRVAYRGSEWIAFSADDREIPVGTTVLVVGLEGIKFKVSPQA
jgi:membrane protein implicated in regulation of membrane protease activity